MARSQPSLRFADGGSFITRWAEGVMRPNSAAKRLREVDAPPPTPAPASPPPPPPPNPRATKDNPAGIRFQDGGGLSKEAVMAAIARQRAAQGGQQPRQEQPRQEQPRQEQPKERSGVGALATDFLRNPGGILKGRMQAAGLEFQDGGHVPGTGEGDKIPAKYEPGEFVVSNDMIDDNPGLREGLSSLRAETLAARGKTVEEADAGATRHMGSLRAADGWDPKGWRMEPPGRTPQLALPAPGNSSRGLVPVPGTGDNGYRPNFTQGKPLADIERGMSQAAEAAQMNQEARAQAAARAQTRATAGILDEANAATRAASGVPGMPGAPDTPAGPSRLRTAGGALGSVGLGIGAGLAGGAAVERARGIGAPGAPSAAGPETALDRQVNQIPGNQDGSLRAPAAQNYDFFKDNEVGRNIGNTLNAAAPLQALGGLARGATAAGAAVKAGIAGRATRAGVGAAGLADDAVIGASFALQNGASEAPNPANSLRIDPNGRTDGPPKSAMNAPVDPNSIRRQDRPGQSPLFTNMPDGGQFGNDTLMARGQPSAQNQAVMDSFPEGGLRGAQAAQYDREVANAQGINALQQRIHGAPEGSIKNGLMTRTPDQQLRDAKVSAGSIHKRTAELGQAELKRIDNASSLRTKADAARYDTDSRSASERYKTDNSLRGDQVRALGDRRTAGLSAALKQQEMFMYGEAFRAAGGDPVQAAQIAAGAGLDPARFTGMAAAGQARTDNSTASAAKRLESLAVRPDGKGGSEVDAGRLAQVQSMATKMAPGWENLPKDKQGEALGRVEAGMNLLEGMNDRRNNSFWQSVGVDGSSASLDSLPEMKGGKLRTVKALEGASTGGGVARKDYKIEVNGHTLYLPRDKLGEKELALLKERGVDISGIQQ